MQQLGRRELCSLECKAVWVMRWREKYYGKKRFSILPPQAETKVPPNYSVRKEREIEKAIKKWKRENESL